MHDLAEFAVMGGPFAGVAGAAGVPLRFLGVPAFAGSGFTHTPDPNAFRSSDEIEILGLPREEAITHLIVKGHSPEKAEDIFERSLTPAYTAADRLPFGLSGKLPTASGEGDSDWELRLKRSAELGAGELLPDVVESGAGMALHPLMRLRRGRSKGQTDEILENIDKTLPDDWNTNRFLNTLDSVDGVDINDFEILVHPDNGKPMLGITWVDSKGNELGYRFIRFDGVNRKGRQRLYLSGFRLVEGEQGFGTGPRIQAALFRELRQMDPPPILRANAAGLSYLKQPGNIGTYVWVDQGFLPMDWGNVRKKLSRSVEELDVPIVHRQRLSTILESDDPSAIWLFADYNQYAVRVGDKTEPLGKYLLMNLDEFEVIMDLANQKQLERFVESTGNQL